MNTAFPPSHWTTCLSSKVFTTEPVFTHTLPHYAALESLSKFLYVGLYLDSALCVLPSSPWLNCSSYDSSGCFLNFVGPFYVQLSLRVSICTWESLLGGQGLSWNGGLIPSPTERSLPAWQEPGSRLEGSFTCLLGAVLWLLWLPSAN